MDEKDLVFEARKGSRDAMKALFQYQVDSTVRKAFSVLGNWAEAEDVAQEAFIMAFRNLRTFKDGMPFKPWLLKIALNIARRKARRKNREESWPLLEWGEKDPPSVEDLVVHKDLRKQVIDGVFKLEEKYRIPVILKYLNDLKESEISKMLKIPVSTVKSRLFVARARLREILKDLKGEEGGL